jgi:hypothetical protein
MTIRFVECKSINVGDDALDLLVLFPSGFAWEVHYDVSVR